MSASVYECHGPALMDGAAYADARRRHAAGVDLDAVHRCLAALRNAGVTYFRDGGDALGVSLRARELAGEYGIVYRSPAFAIHKQGRYGGIVGRAWGDLREYRALVAEAKAEGCDFIKLMFSGIITFREYGGLSCPGLMLIRSITISILCLIFLSSSISSLKSWISPSIRPRT